MFAVAISLAGANSVQAGPGPQVYVPVKTQKQLDALKPNTKITIACSDCGAVMVTKVKKDRSNLHKFECPVCKHSFEITPVAGGKATSARLVCRDSKGKVMNLSLCAEMH